MEEIEGKYYYYANERGCLKDPNVTDALGIGIHDGKKSCSITVNLMRLRDEGRYSPSHFTMQAAAHNDEWRVFTECPEILELLSKRMIPAGEMTSMDPFYGLREHLEKLGYKNLGVLKD